MYNITLLAYRKYKSPTLEPWHKNGKLAIIVYMKKMK